jgi:LmbE family N-acetylglucosaminyl deacetylase
MILVAIVGALALTSITIGGVLVSMRHRAYRRRISYDPRQNCVLGMAGPAIETVSVHCGESGFVLPECLIGPVSGLLELEVRATFSGKLSDPAIEITTGDFRDVQYVERGAQGARFFNISRLLNSRAGGARVHLRGHGFSWGAEDACLHICREKVVADDRVLVVAPHPDDAEIAAFGLYAETQATVVTLTAGDGSDRYQNPMQPWMNLSRKAVATMRVWDSLTIPQLAGVPAEQAINLCLPDGRLAEMHLRSDCDVQLDEVDAADFAALRRMNCSPHIQTDAACTWKSLVHDLSRIVADAKPAIVAAPHPGLDPHPDHLFATVALIEALQSAGHTTGRVFLYTVHNRRSELWPFGPAGSGVTLLPILPDDGECASGFYSHRLSLERQRQKFVALEAMHDVRDIQWPVNSTYRSRIVAELRAWVKGMDITPTSYLRRAVRPDELFFVTSIDGCRALARRAMERRASSRT